MSSLQEIKSRLNSVETTKKITKAMQLVATAKLRRAKNNLDGIQEYFSAVSETFEDLFNSVKDFSKLTPPNHDKKALYILVTSDLGLCGAYNNNVIKLTKKSIKPGDELVIVGAKGISAFKDSKYLIKSYDHVGDVIDYGIPSEISKEAIAKYLTGEIESINIIYTKFINSVMFDHQVKKILPIDVDKDKKNNIKSLTEFEPDPETVIKNAIPLYVSAIIYGGLVESKVSEMSSRRVAMENASDNAEDLISKLGLEYNRARQAKITQEISEIVAGSEGG